MSDPRSVPRRISRSPRRKRRKLDGDRRDLGRGIRRDRVSMRCCADARLGSPQANIPLARRDRDRQLCVSCRRDLGGLVGAVAGSTRDHRTAHPRLGAVLVLDRIPGLRLSLLPLQHARLLAGGTRPSRHQLFVGADSSGSRKSGPGIETARHQERPRTRGNQHGRPLPDLRCNRPCRTHRHRPVATAADTRDERRAGRGDHGRARPPWLPLPASQRSTPFPPARSRTASHPPPCSSKTSTSRRPVHVIRKTGLSFDRGGGLLCWHTSIRHRRSLDPRTRRSARHPGDRSAADYAGRTRDAASGDALFFRRPRFGSGDRRLWLQPSDRIHGRA